MELVTAVVRTICLEKVVKGLKEIGVKGVTNQKLKEWERKLFYTDPTPCTIKLRL